MTITPQAPERVEPELNYCPRNPAVETNLRCGKCGDFICPKCLVHTPVGARCPDCAKVKKNPAYDPSSSETGLAIASGVAAAAGLGIVLGGVAAGAWELGGRFMYQLVAVAGLAGLGWATGEIVYRVSKFKKSRNLQYAAGLCAFAGYVAALVGANLFGLRGAFTDVWPLLGLGVAVYIAMGRVRP